MAAAMISQVLTLSEYHVHAGDVLGGLAEGQIQGCDDVERVHGEVEFNPLLRERLVAVADAGDRVGGSRGQEDGDCDEADHPEEAGRLAVVVVQVQRTSCQKGGGDGCDEGV